MNSFGLTLYHLLARRGQTLAHASRPVGAVVWIIADGDTQALALLRARLEQDHDFHVLMTGPGFDVTPSDHPDDIGDFLTHWMPDVIVATGGQIRPALMAEAARRGIATLLIDAVQPQLLRHSWLPGVLAGAVQRFDTILAVDEMTARQYRKLGALNVSRLGQMQQGSAVLPYHEAERAELAKLFATRPIWLAAQIPQSEEEAVIAAHRAAMRLAHRLLLILIPEDPARAPILAEQMEQSEGWIVARRELNQEPDPEVAVYIAETCDEFGLWYRLAPVCFMGGTLLGTGSTRSPLEAASLGSAMIHGRRTGSYGAEYGRLGAALGSAPASSPVEFAELLSELLAPDRAARLAHAAWAVASEGADVIDRVVALIASKVAR